MLHESYRQLWRHGMLRRVLLVVLAGSFLLCAATDSPWFILVIGSCAFARVGMMILDIIRDFVCAIIDGYYDELYERRNRLHSGAGLTFPTNRGRSGEVV